MRPIAIIVAALALAGCSELHTAKPMNFPPYQQVALVDLSPFSDVGFYPGDYQGAYEARGIVEVVVWQGFDWYPPSNGWNKRKDTEYTPLDPMDAVALAYEKAKGLGGDALMRFEVVLLEDTVRIADESVIRRGVRVSGYAIKRTNE